MTEEQLQEIERRAAAAKWPGSITFQERLDREALLVKFGNDVPALVAEVRRLQEHIAALKETLRRIHGQVVSLAEITEVSE